MLPLPTADSIKSFINLSNSILLDEDDVCACLIIFTKEGGIQKLIEFMYDVKKVKNGMIA